LVETKRLAANFAGFVDAARNKFFGGSGDDTFTGACGDDTLFGEAGDDLFVADASFDGHHDLFGGGGSDRLDYSRRTLGVMIGGDNSEDPST
jgi:Ca2+-binding RTX toxin-like protein